MRGAVTAMSLVIFLAGSIGAKAAEPVLEFQPGDHVCIIGEVDAGHIAFGGFGHFGRAVTKAHDPCCFAHDHRFRDREEITFRDVLVE